MNDWRKDNFPRPQARLPLDAEDWSWREDSGAPGPNPGLESQPARAQSRTKVRTNTGSTSQVGSKSGTARPVPRMPKSRPETQVRSRGITLAGTLLILGLAVLAFAGGRLFGRVEQPVTGDQPETTAQTVPAPTDPAPAAPQL